MVMTTLESAHTMGAGYGQMVGHFTSSQKGALLTKLRDAMNVSGTYRTFTNARGCELREDYWNTA